MKTDLRTRSKAPNNTPPVSFGRRRDRYVRMTRFTAESKTILHPPTDTSIAATMGTSILSTVPSGFALQIAITPPGLPRNRRIGCRAYYCQPRFFVAGQLRESLNKYFSKQTHFARAELFPSGRQTGRILGLFAECLRNAMERTHSINVAESEMHAATRAATDSVKHCLNNA